MLWITIPEVEQFNQVTTEIISIKAQTIQLEHSLVSISKWESKWHKSFLSTKNKTTEETIDYIRCMTITQNVDPTIYYYLSKENIKDIEDYISNPMTATTFNDNNKRSSREIITSELIYYWMIAYQVPVEFEKWHINRLLTLIRVCSIKNTPPKKMSKREIMNRNSALNAARRSSMNSRG